MSWFKRVKAKFSQNWAFVKYIYIICKTLSLTQGVNCKQSCEKNSPQEWQNFKCKNKKIKLQDQDCLLFFCFLFIFTSTLSSEASAGWQVNLEVNGLHQASESPRTHLFRAILDSCGAATATFFCCWFCSATGLMSAHCVSHSKQANICFRMFIIYLWVCENKNVLSACWPGSWLAHPRNMHKVINLRLCICIFMSTRRLDSPEASKKLVLMITSLKPVRCSFFCVCVNTAV